MEKQGLPFFILRALARQLRNWADAVLVGARLIAPQQANADSAETGDTPGASRAASQSAPAAQVFSQEEERGSADAEDPPTHWLARVDAAQPPMHWLGRVQRDAPELPEQQKQFAQNVVKRSPSLPAEQADSTIQPLRGRESWQVKEKSHARGGRSKQEGEEVTEYRDEIKIPASPRNLAPHSSPLPAGQAGHGAQAAHPGVVQSKPTGEVIQAKRGKREGGKSGASRETIHTPPWPRKRADGSVQAAHPGVAHRPSIDQAARTKEDSGAPAGSGARIHTPRWPRKRADGSMQAARTKEDSGAPAGTGRRLHEEGRARRDETRAPASLNAGLAWSALERMERGKETALTGKPGGNSPPSPGGWVSPPAQAQPLPFEESPAQQAGHTLWPQTSLLASVRNPRSPGQNAASEQSQQLPTDMRWPSLPPGELTSDTQDWEMAWRAGERQQRLDEEQRGSSWNV